MEFDAIQKPVILIVVGLPGCGKTAYLEELRRKGWLVFDDFKAGAIDNSPAFSKSRNFEPLLAGIRERQRSAIADIDFCRLQSCQEAEHVLGQVAAGSQIHWCFFAHDRRACEENIRRRNRASLAADLRELDKYSQLYVIPEGTEVRPVWTPAQKTCRQTDFK